MALLQTHENPQRKPAFRALPDFLSMPAFFTVTLLAGPGTVGCLVLHPLKFWRWSNAWSQGLCAFGVLMKLLSAPFILLMTALMRPS